MKRKWIALAAAAALALCGCEAKEPAVEEPELLELKRVYGAQAARRFPPVPQLRSRGAAKTEDETEFLI